MYFLHCVLFQLVDTDEVFITAVNDHASFLASIFFLYCVQLGGGPGKLKVPHQRQLGLGSEQRGLVRCAPSTWQGGWN